jgi:capsule polysaccharide modification protein KpsS
MDVLDDYARAFPNGNVYLVNHGPVGDILQELSSDVQKRCHILQKLTPENLLDVKR